MKINQIVQGINESALKDKADLEAKRKALQDMERQPGHDKEAIRQRKLDLEREARTKGLAEEQSTSGNKVLYAKNPDGSKAYARIKDDAHLAQLQQRYAGSKVKLLSLDRPEVADWLTRSGVGLRDFLPGTVVTNGPAEGQLDEVSLGDYRRKASLSKAGAQIDKVFGSPEKKEKADSIIAKRERGLDRADARGRANAEKLKQKAEQDRIASLRSAKDRLDDIKAELAELEAKFDSYYEYSDDHGEWTRQRELHRKIMAMKKHIADIEALDEADDNFGKPATMMNASPEAKAQAQSIVQQQADKNVISQAKFAGVAPEMEESADPLANVLYTIVVDGKDYGNVRGNEKAMQTIQRFAKQLPDKKWSMKKAEDQQAKETLGEGEPGDLEHELNKKEYNDDKIAGIYDPDKFDAMIDRLKELSDLGPLVSIRGDDGKTRNVPKKDLKK